MFADRCCISPHQLQTEVRMISRAEVYLSGWWLLQQRPLFAPLPTSIWSENSRCWIRFLGTCQRVPYVWRKHANLTYWGRDLNLTSPSQFTSDKVDLPGKWYACGTSDNVTENFLKFDEEISKQSKERPPKNLREGNLRVTPKKTKSQPRSLNILIRSQST